MSGGDLAAVITAMVTVLGTMGAAIKWLWAKIERRFTDVEHKLAACEAREKRQLDLNGKQLIVIELLWQEVDRRTRGSSPILKRSSKLLDDLKEHIDWKEQQT